MLHSNNIFKIAFFACWLCLKTILLLVWLPDARYASDKVCSWWSNRLFKSTGIISVVCVDANPSPFLNHRLLKSQPDSAAARRFLKSVFDFLRWVMRAQHLLYIRFWSGWIIFIPITVQYSSIPKFHHAMFSCALSSWSSSSIQKVYSFQVGEDSLSRFWRSMRSVF